MSPKVKLTLDQIYALIDKVVIPQSPTELKFIEVEVENNVGEILSIDKSIRVSLSNGQIFSISSEGATNELCYHQNT